MQVAHSVDNIWQRPAKPKINGLLPKLFSGKPEMNMITDVLGLTPYGPALLEFSAVRICLGASCPILIQLHCYYLHDWTPIISY